MQLDRRQKFLKYNRARTIKHILYVLPHIYLNTFARTHQIGLNSYIL